MWTIVRLPRRPPPRPPPQTSRREIGPHRPSPQTRSPQIRSPQIRSPQIRQLHVQVALSGGCPALQLHLSSGPPPCSAPRPPHWPPSLGWIPQLGVPHTAIRCTWCTCLTRPPRRHPRAGRAPPPSSLRGRALPSSTASPGRTMGCSSTTRRAGHCRSLGMICSAAPIRRERLPRARAAWEGGA